MQSVPSQDFKCEFCDKAFTKESSLFAHCCVKKSRYLDKDNKNVILGLMAYKRFYQLTSPRSHAPKTYKDMVESKFYNDFVSFGRWLNDAYIIKPLNYIDYVIREQVKIDNWQSSRVYEEYLRSMILKEHPSEAIARSIEWIDSWCEENSVDIKNFYDTMSSNKLVDVLRSAKISPWLIFMSKRKYDILRRFDAGQEKLLNSLLKPAVWDLKMRKYKKELTEYQELLGELNL